MNTLIRMAISVLTISVAGCSFSGNSYNFEQQKAERDVMVARVLAQPLSMETAIRLGSRVVLSVPVPAQGVEAATQARLEADCNSSTLSMRYRKPRFWVRAATVATQPQSAEIVRQLCKVNGGAPWVKLDTNGTDILFLDPASISGGQGNKFVWGGIDYGQTRVGAEGKSLYDLVLARFQLNCESGLVTTRLVYRVDKGVLSDSPPEPWDSLFDMAQRTRLIQAVCNQKENLSELPALELRKKIRPALAVPQVPAPLLNQISTLPRGNPKYALSHVQMTYDLTSPMFPVMKKSDVPMDLYLKPGPGPGLWENQTVGMIGIDEAIISWRGLIDLASTHAPAEVADASAVTRSSLAKVELEGDWRTLKPGSLLGYSEQFLGQKRDFFTVSWACQVGDSYAAANTLAALKGDARLVTCKQSSSQKETRTYIYLEAYDLFIKTSDATGLVVQANTLKAFE